MYALAFAMQKKNAKDIKQKLRSPSRDYLASELVRHLGTIIDTKSSGSVLAREPIEGSEFQIFCYFVDVVDTSVGVVFISTRHLTL